MEKPNYKYRCWFQQQGHFCGKYKLQVFESGEDTKYLYLMQWNFENPKEIFHFLKSYFPGIQHSDWDSTSNVIGINAERDSDHKVVEMSRSSQQGKQHQQSEAPPPRNRPIRVRALPVLDFA
jgi:hypothetical protein